MKILLFLLLEWCMLSNVIAGLYDGPIGARSASLAYATVAERNVWSSFSNQAGLAWLQGPVTGFCYENRFLMKAYAIQAGVLAIPLKPGTGAFNYRYFGYSRYHEMKLGLSFARKLFKSLAIGVQLNYHQTSLPEDYKYFNALSADLGILYSPMEHLFIGIHVSNPNRVHSQAREGEYIPTIYRAGMEYQFMEKLTILLETEKDLLHHPYYRAGVEIEIVPALDLEIGCSSGYPEYAFGMGYHYKKIIFHLAMTHHPMLGYTPHISLTFNLSHAK